MTHPGLANWLATAVVDLLTANGIPAQVSAKATDTTDAEIALSTTTFLQVTVDMTLVPFSRQKNGAIVLHLDQEMSSPNEVLAWAKENSRGGSD